MPTETIIILSCIVTAFLAFGVTLAYGEYQTRNLKRDEPAPAKAEEREDRWREAA